MAPTTAGSPVWRRGAPEGHPPRTPRRSSTERAVERAQAGVGELLATDAVRSMTRTYLGVTFSPRGRRRLKGIAEPIALDRVTTTGPADWWEDVGRFAAP
ncbi:MAG: hypothetical protein ACRDFY_11145 [Candidatus Limnocylindria bacterium]